MPAVSIIVLNWNGLDYVGECLDSLLDQAYRDFELIVVDNGSTDGSLELLRDRYEGRLKLIENGENLGYAGGNNRGFEEATGDWIALVNNDVVADRYWLEKLMHVVQDGDFDERVGMLASKVLSYDDRDLIDNTGHLAYPDGLNRGRDRLERDGRQYDSEREALFPSGCAGLYKREMIEQTGGFDERFFAYGDDADLGLRGRLLGWKCVFVPGARVYHMYSASTSAYSTFKAYHVERNRVWVMLKTYPFSMVWRSPWYTMLRYFLQAWGALSGRGAAGELTRESGPFSLVSTLLRANWDAWKAAPQMWVERRRLWSNAKIDERQMKRLLDSHRIGAVEISLKE